MLKRYANKLADRVVRPAGAAGPGGRARAKERALDFDGIAAVGHSIRSGAPPPPPPPCALRASQPLRTRALGRLPAAPGTPRPPRSIPRLAYCCG